MVYTWKFKESQFDKISPTFVAYCRAFSLLDKIRELKIEKKTSLEGPEKLLSIISRLAEGCIRKVTQLNDKLRDNKISATERKNIENTIRAILFSINILYSFLRYVEATRLSRNPTGMIRPWELLVRKHNADLNIIIRPQWKYNYSYYYIIKYFVQINEIVRDQTSKEELSKAGPHFPILSFAGLERDNVLLHILLAHEIGHLIDEMKEISSINIHSDDILSTFKIPQIAEKLQKYYELSLNLRSEEDKLRGVTRDTPSIGLFIQHEVLSQAQVELVSKIIKWLQEITADIIAVRIIGPSFIFALYQTQLAQVSKMGPAGDYPPPQVRIERCIEYWDTLDKDEKFFDAKEDEEANCKDIKRCIKEYLNYIKKKESEISPELSTIDRLKKERYDLLTEILQEAIRNSLNSIKDLIQQRIEPYKIDNTIFQLIELLENRITPIRSEDKSGENVFSKCDIASILNAGWIFWLTYEKEHPKEIEKEGIKEVVSLDKLRMVHYDPLVEISDLILKGIDLTDFSNKFTGLK